MTVKTVGRIVPAMKAVEVIGKAERAAALLDPTRLRLIERLAEPDSASGLARKLGLPRQRINYHLRALESAGLVEEVETRRRGNCTERLVRATAFAYVIDPAVLGAIGASPRRLADRASWARFEVDVRFATPESRAAFTEELARALASLAARYHHPDAPADHAFRFVIGGYPAPAPPAGANPAPQSAAPDATGFPDSEE